LFARRTEVRPFTAAQIKLLETFADQAVIAIENVRLFQELTEALEQQTATSNILQVIASSPTDIQPVLDAVAESAVRLCAAEDASIRLVDGNLLRLGAHYGMIPMDRRGTRSTVEPAFSNGRAAVDRQLIHIEDMLAVVETEFPGTRVSGRDIHTMVATPLLREGVAIGVIGLRRTDIQPFTDKQIALLKTFADQAAIAIENVRLFKELQVRNRDLTEALEQQTATSEILRVIASSPTDVQPVLDVVAESAARLCEAADANIYRIEGQGYRLVASYGYMSIPEPNRIRPLVRGLPPGRAMVDREIVHVDDMLSPKAQAEFPEAWTFNQVARLRTVLAAPLLREDVAIGAIFIRSIEVRPFSEKQIALLKTFADQAVIAIENVRLFQELKESLEQQTATSEILSVIASSPTNIQPVLNSVAESAARLCDATDAQIARVEGDFIQQWASYGTQPGPDQGEKRPLTRGFVGSRAVVDRQTIHVHDLAAESDSEYPESKLLQRRFGTRTILATPLMREGVPSA
jgi:GAF domain-containing protein